MRAVILAALVCGAGVVALALTSDHQDDKVGWAIFGPVVVWSFIGTGLYAWGRRPESRTGLLMVLLGFAWCVPALSFANTALPYSVAQVAGGLWGGVFLQVLMSFPSRRLPPGRDRAIVLAGYVFFTVASIPGAALRGPARARLRRLPGQPPPDTARRGPCERRPGLSGGALRRPPPRRARPARAALAAPVPAQTAPAHAGLRLRPAHLLDSDRRHRRRATCTTAPSRGW